MILKEVNQRNGVWVPGKVDNSFESQYLKIRSIENRVYTDEEVAQLPYLKNEHPQYKEWRLRQKSTERFLNYLQKNKFKRIIEVGCGNGWFSQCCKPYVDYVAGVDVNLTELEQASRVFDKRNIDFVYWDIFSESPFLEQFDLIVFNASIQYFNDFNGTIERAKSLIGKGEIHIVDTPFYKLNDIAQAKERTIAYYRSMGVPEMANNYYHHAAELLASFDVMYQPTVNKLLKRVMPKDMPFGWYRLSC